MGSVWHRHFCVRGIFSAIFRLHTAYRFAAITLSIILLVAHEHRPWIVATHRFDPGQGSQIDDDVAYRL
jgi:hypothetical protein